MVCIVSVNKFKLGTQATCDGIFLKSSIINVIYHFFFVDLSIKKRKKKKPIKID